MTCHSYTSYTTNKDRTYYSKCEICISKTYSMHKKCLMLEDTTMILCEIDTFKMYNNYT